MDVKKKLEEQLTDIESLLRQYSEYEEFDEWIKLNELKLNILQALQKYEWTTVEMSDKSISLKVSDTMRKEVLEMDAKKKLEEMVAEIEDKVGHLQVGRDSALIAELLKLTYNILLDLKNS